MLPEIATLTIQYWDEVVSKFRDIPKCIPYAKARKVLRELKQQEKRGSWKA